MSFQSQYQHDCEEKGFITDRAQLAAVDLLQQLFLQLKSYNKNSLWSRIKRYSGLTRPIKGIYFWGGVGRGKTYLMDLFCDTLQKESNSRVRRIHFHRFMYWLHEQLKLNKGEVNPLKKIASQLSDDIDVLCFDEFFVAEIGDAMLLGRLFETLFAKGIVLVSTSNIPPDRLYYKGLHRDRFLPTIELIKQNTQVFQMDGGRDYRLRTLKKVATYYSPADKQSEQALWSSYQKLGANDMQPGKTVSEVIIAEREIPVRAISNKIIWFDFAHLCQGPRSAADYIEISRLYPTVILSNVPQLDDSVIAEVRRFITLIDEFYEHHVKLIISAANPLDSLYIGEELSFEFRRTSSRLEEMQSESYLGLEHLP